MKKLFLIFGGLSILSLMGAGCRLSPLGEQPIADDSTSVSQLEKENERLKDDLADLKKQVDRMDTEENKTMEKEDVMEKKSLDGTRDSDADASEEDSEDKNLNERGREIISESYVIEDLDPNRSDFFLVSNKNPDPAYNSLPGFKFGCEEYLYQTSVELDEEKTQSDLATALVQLLTYKPIENEGMNAVRGKGFTLENVRYNSGVRIIELGAEEVSTGGVCEDARIKAQIEETVALYSEDFEIWLNGSAQEWQCLFDGSGECN